MNIDFDNLPPRNEMVDMVAQMGIDDTLMNLNAARELTLSKSGKDEEVTDAQSHMSILLARRLRELRSTSRAKKSKAKAAPDAPLGDLLKGI